MVYVTSMMMTHISRQIYHQTKPIDSKILTTGRGFQFLLYANCCAKNFTYNHIYHRKSRGIPKGINFCFIDYTKAFESVDYHKLWKILIEIRIPDHLTCLLRNLYVGQEATVRTRHGTTDWFQIGKGVCQGCIL